MDPHAPKDPAKVDKLTLKNGSQVGDKFNSLIMGKRGPNLLADVAYLEETAHFNRERIPERVVHAKGGAAMGYFLVTNDEITKYTKASMFQFVNKRTPVTARFSHVSGESGIADTARDVRGFAVRFKSDEGNWDLVGNNLPVFFVRDPINFTSLIHSQKRNPKTHLKDPDAFWDFAACRPESLHLMLMLFSERGTPDGFRHMHGFGVNTFKLVNQNQEHCYAKFHWICDQRVRNLSAKRAIEIAGIDPDYALRDLMVNISAGNTPSWTLKVQIMSPKDAASVKFNPFDATKTWPHAEFPLIEVGKMTLDENPDNYFAEVEQLAFSPASMVPGIEASPDIMLVGRMMSYADAQRYRLGVNHTDMPCNKPRCPVMTPTYCDGITYVSNTPGSLPNYVPSIKYKSMETLNKDFVEHKQEFSGHQGRFDSANEDNFSQPKVFVQKVLNETSRKTLITNLAQHIAMVTNKAVRALLLKQFKQIDTTFAGALEKEIQVNSKHGH